MPKTPKPKVNPYRVQESVYVSMEGPLETVIANLREAAAGYEDVTISWDYGWDDAELLVLGWRPMTPKEEAAYDKKQAALRAAERLRKEQLEEAERKQYEQLKKKFEGG